MNTPLATPVRHAKLGISSTKSLPLANEYKKLLNEQYQRLATKHQQDLDLIDDIRSYVKARLSIERDYTTALNKLGKQHSGHIAKKFTLLNQCDPPPTSVASATNKSNGKDENNNNNNNLSIEEQRENDLTSDSRLQKRLANNGQDEPEKPCTLYKVWSEHINRLQLTSKNRADQFEQLIMIVDKLKEIRSHKASIGKKCLDTHLRRIHEDILVSMVDVEKARKLYYEDESQAKKARENEEKIKKKRSGLLTKFTDLQARKEKTSAQREANDIQSTQARNDYIMALAAGNAHLGHYYQRDLNDFIHIIDDGVLDHCKIFMATLSECDINSLKDALTHAQYWSKMINLTGSQRTNYIFLECGQSNCLKSKSNLVFEPCNNDPIHSISLEHNADYALQHEIDKWFTWFKKECRNLSQLMHQLDTCQHALAEGKKSIELNGQNAEELEPKIIELKQQIRKSEAAKLKAQARLKVIKEGGMQIEEWSTVESEIRADMARAQEELKAKRLKELVKEKSSLEEQSESVEQSKPTVGGNYLYGEQMDQVQLQVSKNSDDSGDGESLNNLASVSRSNSNLMQKQQNATSGYSALADPSLAWQDDFSNAWGSSQGNQNIVVTDSFSNDTIKSPGTIKQKDIDQNQSYDLLGASNKPNVGPQLNQGTSMTVQSSSPLSAIVDGPQSSTSPYQGMIGEAYKSDFECDYNRIGHFARSAASSAEPFNQAVHQADLLGRPLSEMMDSRADDIKAGSENKFDEQIEDSNEVYAMLGKRVVTLYSFDKTNDDDLAFEEGEILKVVEISDENWVKAKNEATSEEGFVPASYIRLQDARVELESMEKECSTDVANEWNPDSNYNVTSMDSEKVSGWSGDGNIQTEADPAQTQSAMYCRAIYNYEPDSNTFEEDGLPHLALVQGEVMRIIDQGEDDGWWLVEKEDTSTRGHVPSMLVEEILDGDDEQDDGDASEYSDDKGSDGSAKAMPSFEPPILEANHSDSVGNQITKSDEQCEAPDPVPQQTSSSLIPTSFIIIEPTPEVESRKVDESGTSRTPDEVNGAGTSTRVTGPELPSNASYSIVNEEFVLEMPERKPNVEIIENLVTSEDNSQELSQELSSKAPVVSYEPLSEVDSVEMPAPPSVVIESFFDDKQDKSSSFDEDIEEEKENPLDSDISPTYMQKEIHHTVNVDVSPILRLRAEEFSKQIIAEALMLAPKTDVGSPTSFCSETNDGSLE